MQSSRATALPDPVLSRRIPAPPATPSASGMTVETGDPWLTVSGEWYSLSLPADLAGLVRSPYAVLLGADGHNWSDISLFAAVDTTIARDETLAIGPLRIERESDSVTLVVPSRSSVWARRETVIRCTPTTVELAVRIEGDGRIDEVVLGGGAGVLPSGASGTFRSSIGFRSLFAPVPTEPVAFVRASRAGAVLGVNGDADPGRLHGIFSPPPLVFGLGRAAPHSATESDGAGWLALSVREAVDRLTCTAVRYEPLDGGFLVRFAYEGHTAVAGEWESPRLVFAPADDALSTVAVHRRDLVDHGFAPTTTPDVQSWWLEPIFCGWGAQCARSVRHLHGVADVRAETEPEERGEEDLVVLLAPQYARQDVYDEFLATLAEAELDPGVIVIDDRWQDQYGTAEPDLDHWPDLGGWIAARHDEGRKVLLWWKAWDPAGLPADECVRTADGHPVAVDPGNPAYLERLSGIVDRLLGPAGLDADGLKVDFTQRTPSGRSLRHAGGSWGIAALHRLLVTIREAAERAKPDALVITHAVHPSFADAGHMVRLNDVLERDIADVPVPVVDQLRARHAIAARALPEHPVDTDQWPMPNRDEWLAYVEAQGEFGVPALYYLEAMDRSGESVRPEDLARVKASWDRYRAGLP